MNKKKQALVALYSFVFVALKGDISEMLCNLGRLRLII